MQPTTWERIVSEYNRIMRHHGHTVVSFLLSFIAIVLISILVEVFVFNFSYWGSLGNEEVDLTERLTLSQNAEGQYRLTEIDHEIEFNDLVLHLENIRIDFSSNQSAKNLQLKIQFTDGAHLTYFDSTEYSAGIPTTTVPTNSDNLEYIKLSTVGISDNLKVEIVGDNVRYPIMIDGVFANCVIPFQFNPVRFFAAFVCLLLCYLFRPKSKLYSMYLVNHPRFSKAFVVCFVTFEIALASSFLFLGSNLVGVATSSYNWGSWDGHSLINTYEVGGSNAQQYSYLAEAFADGQLYLEEEPPSWLVEMDNPYDKGARSELQKETGESYLWDVVYYDGHYYVYFGVVPVLVFYLPFYLITHSYFPTAIGVLISVILFILGCTALLDRFARYHFNRVSIGLYLLLQLPLIFCSGIVYILKHPTFYSLPITLALAFSVWGLYLWLRGRGAQKPYASFILGSTCMALVAGCRPQLLVLSCIAFPLFWNHYITKRNLFCKKGVLEFSCLIVPFVLIGAGLMWYNAARFGSPFDFGSAYNLTTNDMTQRGWDWARLMPALFAFFVQTPNTVGTFPYIQACVFDTTYMGQTIKEVTYGGLFATVPLLWIVLFSGGAIKFRMRKRGSKTIAGVMAVLLASAVIVAMADAEMAGVLQRYFADFSFMLLLAAILVAFLYNETLDHFSTVFSVLVKVLLILVALSLVYQVCLAFVPETGWYSNVYPWAYQRIVHMFQFWT